jgi:hypothetical protein
MISEQEMLGRGLSPAGAAGTLIDRGCAKKAADRVALFFRRARRFICPIQTAQQSKCGPEEGLTYA